MIYADNNDGGIPLPIRKNINDDNVMKGYWPYYIYEDMTGIKFKGEVSLIHKLKCSKHLTMT